MREIIRQTFALVAGAALLAVVLSSTGVFAQDGVVPVAVQGVVAQNDVMQYQGQLFNPNGGQALANATVAMSFRLYPQAGGGTPLWIEDKQIVTNSDGLFNTLLGSVNSLNFDLFDGRDLFLGVAVNGEEGAPRLPIGYVPYAIWARNADKLDGRGSGEYLQAIAHGIVDENGNRVNGRGFSSRVGGDNVYEISIDGHSYNLNDYVTVVTPITQSSCPKPTIAGTNSGDGKLLVELYNRDGGEVRCKFHFLVTRP